MLDFRKPRSIGHGNLYIKFVGFLFSSCPIEIGPSFFSFSFLVLIGNKLCMIILGDLINMHNFYLKKKKKGLRRVLER